MNRELMEDRIMQLLGNNVTPLRPYHIESINKKKNGNFGFSYLGFMLYANGRNRKSCNKKYPCGLVYSDGDNIFSMALFRKQTEPEGNYHLHIISPNGQESIEKAIEIANFIQRVDVFSKSYVYLRHLSEAQYYQALKIGASDILSAPWHPDAHSEDETFNHRIIKISDLIELSGENIFVKTLHDGGSKGFRSKARLAYNRFLNFLHRNDLTLTFENFCSSTHEDQAKELVIRHFSMLSNSIGSTPEDYFNLIEKFPNVSNNEFIGLIGYLSGKNCSYLPVALFLGEKIKGDTIGLYATFSLRDPQILPNDIHHQGYTAISQFIYLNVMKIIKKIGFEYVDLGGSEIERLNTFKRQLGAKEMKTYWAVKAPN
ncbi:hypothetical protein GF348_03370 [candidate division KSB3 bacterium]|nr:hypothetical protein [candidate division KSB3 bacterium]